MKYRYSLVINCILLCIATTTCKNNNDNYSDLDIYQKTGASVAARKYVEGEYDCSNFSVQFFKDCLNAGLPCRVRIGEAGGKGFTSGNHAWNSVWINGQWLDWEPQENNIHKGHKQTITKVDSTAGWDSYSCEELERIMYELIGKNVPVSIVDSHEIDKYLYEDSPFNFYFPGLHIGTDITLPEYNLTYFRNSLPNNGDGLFYITFSNNAVHWIYNMNNNFFAIVNLRSIDPVPGRSIMGDNSESMDFSNGGEFFKPVSSVWPKNDY